MALTLFAHPFSSYCHKVLIALWERDIPFAYRNLEDPEADKERKALWPFGKFPVLVDDGLVIGESSSIIEHLDLRHGTAPRLLPDDPAAALEVRLLDRFFDRHVMTPVQQAVGAAIAAGDGPRDVGVPAAAAALDRAYAWLEIRLAGRQWAAGMAFSMADCAAAPSLFYADWVHPIGDGFPVVRAYRARLLARPSMARAVAEARPYRGYFPLGAPDRD